MDFTGERFINQNIGVRIASDHWNRYLFTQDLVKDKIVLDAACGEGFGSDFMALHAKEVYGIDISKEAVSFAKNKYIRKNLKYKVGSVVKLDFPDHFFDVVVSFETIEHVGPKEQAAFLKEIKRVLKKNGILIISTPDKAYYSDLNNFKNKYHIKEFCKEEFYDFLKSTFDNVMMYEQSSNNSSTISNGNYKKRKRFYIGRDDNFSYSINKKSVHPYDYLVAICSDLDVAFDYEISVVDDNDYYVRDLQNSYEVRIQKLTQELEQKDINNISFEDKLTEYDRKLILLQSELSENKNELSKHKNELNNYKKELEEFRGFKNGLIWRILGKYRRIKELFGNKITTD
ncbi:MAG: methyltransferase domain-containing protein [Candidatus Pacearchaeota archaeon]